MFKCHKILILFSISLLVILTSCSDEKKIEEKIRPVRYMEVTTEGGGSMRVFTGAAKTGIESKLSFKVGGTIKKINVKVGDFVNKGGLIAEIDDMDYKIKVKETEAGLKQVESQVINAKNNYTRVKTLYETNSISKSELDGARAQYESAIANVEGMRSTLEYTRLQLSYTRLIAPESGSIAVCNSENNENVQVGQPTVEGAAVTATVLGRSKGPKVIIFKYSGRSTYKKKTGHRQHFTRLRVDSITA